MNMNTKQALSEAMRHAAGYTGRVRALLALSKEVPAEMFTRLAGQHPDTMERDLEWAERDYQRAKAEYEKHCREIGEPAYYTYNED